MKRDEIDIDVGEAEHGRRWSIARASIPLPMAGLVLVQCLGGSWWASGLSSDVRAVIKHQEAMEQQAYQQKDAERDFALRDDRISELGRRVETLERTTRQEKQRAAAQADDSDFVSRLLGLNKKKR